LSVESPIAAFGIQANRTFGPACSDYHIWLRRIQAAFDPNTASDPFFYVESLPGKKQVTLVYNHIDEIKL
jgi:hypothetical protein